MWSAILAALQAIPILVEVIREAIKLITKISEDIAKQRALSEFRHAVDYAKESKDQRALEKLLRNKELDYDKLKKTLEELKGN